MTIGISVAGSTAAAFASVPRSLLSSELSFLLRALTPSHSTSGSAAIASSDRRQAGLVVVVVGTEELHTEARQLPFERLVWLDS